MSSYPHVTFQGVSFVKIHAKSQVSQSEAEPLSHPMRPKSSLRSLLAPSRLTLDECADSFFNFLLVRPAEDPLMDSELDFLRSEEAADDLDFDLDLGLVFDVF